MWEILAERSLSELLITLTGDSVSPKSGYNTPAATCTPRGVVDVDQEQILPDIAPGGS